MRKSCRYGKRLSKENRGDRIKRLEKAIRLTVVILSILFILYTILSVVQFFAKGSDEKYPESESEYSEDVSNQPENIPTAEESSGHSDDSVESYYESSDVLRLDWTEYDFCSAEHEVKDKEEIEKIEVPHTEEEVIMMEYIVEAEAHTLSLEHKTLIACVIVNRLYSDLWDYESISEVILAKNQFSSLFNYYNHVQEPDEDTKEAVRLVLSGEVDREEVSNEAVFFYNPDRCGGYINFFERRELVKEMDGHRFFR